MTVIPATLALIVTVLGLSIALVPTDFERRLQTLALRHGRVGRLAQRAATVPATASLGIRDALAHVRSRDPALLGAFVYWACQIGVLWASFQAFGESPPLAVLVVAFFVGMLGNLLPLPGGIGGVDGGMIGAFAAFNVDTGPRGRRGARLPRLHLLASDDPRRDRLPPAAQDRRALENRARGATLYKLK